MPKEDNICLPLSNTITDNIVTSEWREQYLNKFLKESLPRSDVDSIKSNLQKNFILNKHRAKRDNIKKTRKASFYTARKCILLGLNKSEVKQDLSYQSILPLNSLWLGYMKNLLSIQDFSEIKLNPLDNNYEIIVQRLTKADYHGAKISVTKSKCPSMIDISGIVIQDTKNMFRLISKDNVIRSIPKVTSVFSIHLKDLILNVEGRDLCIRPAERSVKKLKMTNSFNF